MAVEALVVDVPHTIAAQGTTYQEFSVAHGRNLLITSDVEVIYHPDGAGKDGTAPSATEQFRFSAGTFSIRLPRSKSGSKSVPDDDSALVAGCSFAIAAVTGTANLAVLVVRENVSS